MKTPCKTCGKISENMRVDSDGKFSPVNERTMVEALTAMTDDELYSTLQQAFDHRKVGYSEAANEYGWPGREAKLAVIRHILCN